MGISRRSFLGLGVAAGAAFALPFVNRPAAATTLPAEPWAQMLVAAARAQIGVTMLYDPSYSKIAYPGGDVPRLRGVCTDVLVRAYRDALEIDLQRLVHEDMTRAFAVYPRTWGLTRPDSNIDHRRVPNLATFLKRKEAELSISDAGVDYRPGDIVAQRLPGNRPHIMIVSDVLNAGGSRPLAIHNIGEGAQMEDVLFSFKITGHYRYSG